MSVPKTGTSSEDEPSEEAVFLEMGQDVETRMAAKQRAIMKAVLHHGQLRDDGTLDSHMVRNHVQTQLAYIDEVFGKYGRVARYTTDVDSPQVEVVANPVGRGKDTKEVLYPLIQQYATVSEDGTINPDAVVKKEGPDGQSFSRTVIYRNVGRACRVNVPWKDRPAHLYEDGESELDENSEIMDEDVLNTVLPRIDLPSDPHDAFKQGWKMKMKWDDMVSENE